MPFYIVEKGRLSKHADKKKVYFVKGDVIELDLKSAEHLLKDGTISIPKEFPKEETHQEIKIEQPVQAADETSADNGNLLDLAEVEEKGAEEVKEVVTPVEEKKDSVINPATIPSVDKSTKSRKRNWIEV